MILGRNVLMFFLAQVVAPKFLRYKDLSPVTLASAN